MVVTGAGAGIMGAAQEGAGGEQSFGLNIRLPFEQEANPWIASDPKLITFKYFFTRKLFLVKEASAVVLFPGGFGTMDECFELLTLMQTGKSTIVPVVLRGDGAQAVLAHLGRASCGARWWIAGSSKPTTPAFYRIVDSVEDAVGEVTDFYRVFHSSRIVGDHLVFRLTRALTDDEVREIQRRVRGHPEGAARPGAGPGAAGAERVSRAAAADHPVQPLVLLAAAPPHRPRQSLGAPIWPPSPPTFGVPRRSRGTASVSSRGAQPGYSGSGRSSVIWHSVQTHVRITILVWSSRRSVHGMNASRPHRGQRSGLAPGGSCDGNHGTFAGMRRSTASRRMPACEIAAYGGALTMRRPAAARVQYRHASLPGRARADQPHRGRPRGQRDEDPRRPRAGARRSAAGWWPSPSWPSPAIRPRTCCFKSAFIEANLRALADAGAGPRPASPRSSASSTSATTSSTRRRCSTTAPWPASTTSSTCRTTACSTRTATSRPAPRRRCSRWASTTFARQHLRGHLVPDGPDDAAGAGRRRAGRHHQRLALPRRQGRTSASG